MDNNPSKNQIRNQLALRSFIDDLIKEKNDSSLRPEELVGVKKIMLDELNEMINVHLIKSLSEENQRQLDKLLDQNTSDDDLDKFFQQKIPNLEAELASVMMNFRAAYLMPLNGEDSAEPSAASSSTSSSRASQAAPASQSVDVSAASSAPPAPKTPPKMPPPMPVKPF